MVKKATNIGVPGDALIVEVGSAFGYGMWIARHFGHPILGFECRGDEYERLRKQFEDDRDVKVVNACVADKPALPNSIVQVIRRACWRERLQKALGSQREYRRTRRWRRRG